MDMRSLSDWFRERGSSDVGLMGMSLGGYTSALCATVDPNLRFVVPIIPLASLADFALDGGRLVGTPHEQRIQHELLERVFAAVSPLTHSCRVPADGRLVIAARGDRVTPTKHAERLSRHFEIEPQVVAGGHLLWTGRREGFRSVGKMLGGMGLLTS